MSIYQWVLFFLFIQIIHFLGTWKLYEIAGRKRWEALIPVYNAIILMKIIGRPTWWTLLLFIPIINLLLALYLLLARGCSRSNRFGHPRRSTVLEKLCAWFIIFVTILSLIATGSLISYMLQSNELTTPTTIIQKSTEYF